MNLVKHAREFLLFYDGNAWINKKGSSLFAVKIGSYHWAEAFKIVGFYLPSKFSSLFGTKNIGLYRYNGLAVIQQPNRPKMDKKRKEIIALFQSERLSITIGTKLTFYMSHSI